MGHTTLAWSHVTRTTTRIRNLGIVLAAATALFIFGSSAADAADDPYRFEGNGWGHGVGLSQYGAQARATAGQSAEQIVTTYYTGTSLSDGSGLEPWFTTDDTPLWVGLLEDRTRFDFQAAAGTLGLCQGTGACPNPDLGAPAVGQPWSFRSTGSNTCQFYNGENPVGDEGNCFARVLLGSDETTRVQLVDKARTYARGEIVIRPVTSTQFHVMVELSIEDYMLGIGEAVLSWKPAALQAQALASRTFASYRAMTFGPESGFSTSVKNDCWCHVEDNSSDQVYKGWEIESYPKFGINWVNAVQATAGQYITHPNSAYTKFGIILALFSSSNGGTSESNTVAFSTGQVFPYLVSIPDPYSLSGNPYAPWPGGRLVAGATVASKLPELTVVERIRVVETNPSGSAKTVLFEGLNGATPATTTQTGLWTRSNLGLRSTFITKICRERGPYDDDGCSFFEHNIVNINAAGFVGTLPGNDYNDDLDMTRSTMAAFLAAGLNLPATSTNYFPDDDTDPNHAAINALAEAGIVIGFEDGTYRPLKTVTRGEMSVFLARALGVNLPSSVPDPFPDVLGDSWFGPAVAEILSRGITNGHQDGTYKPEQNTNRGQMAAFIDRAFLGGF